MPLQLDRLLAGDFLLVAWCLLVSGMWLAWRLTPPRRQRIAHILRYLVLAICVAGLWIPFGVMNPALVIVVLILLAFFAIRGFPHPDAEAEQHFEAVVLPTWQRIIRIGVKLVLVAAIGVLLAISGYVCVYAYYATPDIVGFSGFANPDNSFEGKFLYLFLGLVFPLALFLAVLFEAFRPPTVDDTLRPARFYLLAAWSLAMGVFFAWVSMMNPTDAIKAAQRTGYVATWQPLPCPAFPLDCTAQPTSARD